MHVIAIAQRTGGIFRTNSHFVYLWTICSSRWPLITDRWKNVSRRRASTCCCCCCLSSAEVMLEGEKRSFSPEHHPLDWRMVRILRSFVVFLLLDGLICMPERFFPVAARMKRKQDGFIDSRSVCVRSSKNKTKRNHRFRLCRLPDITSRGCELWRGSIF